MLFRSASQIDRAVAVGVGGATPELAAGIPAGAGGAQGHRLAALWAGGNGIRRISLIGPIRGILSSSRCPCGQARGGELLGVAAVLDERALERGELPVEEVVGLVDEADERLWRSW